MIRSLIFIFAAVLATTTTRAQTIDGDVTISWVLPTEGCDFAFSPPVCGPLPANAITSVDVFVSKTPIPDNVATPATIVLAGAPVGIPEPYVLNARNGETFYFRVRANAGARKGQLSNEVSRVVQVDLTPGAPTSVTVQMKISI